jgi:hypothetical protein
MTPEDYGMTATEWEAFTALLPKDELRTGAPKQDAASAMRNSMKLRENNSGWGAAMVAYMRRIGMSWREMEDLTGIPQATLREWFKKPPRTPRWRRGNR